MIAVTNLVKEFNGQAILRGVSLTVRRGEVAVVIGPSGGGKSTLLRCINGLEPFLKGEVCIDGKLRLDGKAGAGRTLQELRRRVGMVFQQFNLFPHMTVLENVLTGPQFVLGMSATQAKPQAERLLARVGMDHKARAYPDELSGGQQQRVAIARALAVNPEAILFDEPTSALDPQMAVEVQNVISDLAKAGQTMLIVTHAMTFARQVAHTIHVMHGGRVEEAGEPGQIFERPSSPITRKFLSSSQVRPVSSDAAEPI